MRINLPPSQKHLLASVFLVRIDKVGYFIGLYQQRYPPE